MCISYLLPITQVLPSLELNNHGDYVASIKKYIIFSDVSVLVQFALLERSSGAVERAEALFEQMLAVYPQRVDVCAVYIDMLVKTGDVEHVR